MSKAPPPGIKVIAKNRRAHQRYAIIEALEAGLSLLGHEVKSLRQGKISLEESLVRINNGQAVLFNAHIPPYSYLTHVSYDPVRSRKLLMHKKEILRLSGEMQTKGLALIPLEIYFKNGIAKLTVGLGKSKNNEDRREEIKKRESDREIRRFRA